MLDWIFEGIATWVASVMTQIMDAISGVFIGALGTDMTAMEEYFPFAVSAYTIIQYTAWALLFLVAVWQIFRAFSGPLGETENPLTILARGAIFGFLIAYAKPIFSLALDIARAPYTALMDSTLDPGDFTFAGIEQALTNGLTTIPGRPSTTGLCIRRPVATTMCSRTAAAASGTPSPARQQWSAGRSTRTASPSTTRTVCAPSTWRPSAIRLRRPHTASRRSGPRASASRPGKRPELHRMLHDLI